MTSPFLFFVGIDWGSTTHHGCLLEANGSVRGSRAFPHGGAGQAELVRWLPRPGPPPGSSRSPSRRPTGRSRGLAGRRLCGVRHRSLRGSLRLLRGEGRRCWMLARALRADPGRLALARPPTARTHPDHQRTHLPAIRQQLWATTPNCSRSPTSSINSPTPGSASSGQGQNPRTRPQAAVSTLAKLLKKHGIRRLNAKGLWEILHAPALTVAPGAARISQDSDVRELKAFCGN